MSERLYSAEEICELLERAQALGFCLDADSPLERLTVVELERLVNTKQ